MTVLLVKRTWSALTKYVRTGSFETTYSPYFIYDGRTALLHVLMSRRGGDSSVSHCTSLYGVERPVAIKQELYKAA